jgi:hypothetical protein
VAAAGTGYRQRRCRSGSEEREADPAAIWHRYFLFIGGSSTKLPHMPLGLAWLAFFTILIFIVTPELLVSGAV